MMHSQRRTEGLLIEELPEETVVYDTTRHEAHCLNRAATLVWNHCDGRTSGAEMAQLLREDLGLAADETTVGLIVEQLEMLHLLEEQPVRPASVARRSRRTMARQLAAYGLAGMVLTIAAPTIAQAASCGSKGQPCCPGNICFGGCQCNGNTSKCEGC
jgi:hypothetical protein